MIRGDNGTIRNIDSTKYIYVNIYYSDGSRKRTTFQRALVEWFIGRELSKEEVIIFKDGNTKNISISNLKLSTRKEANKIFAIQQYEKSSEPPLS